MRKKKGLCTLGLNSIVVIRSMINEDRKPKAVNFHFAFQITLSKGVDIVVVSILSLKKTEIINNFGRN